MASPRGVFALSCALLLLACGLGLAQWHTNGIAAPKLAKPLYAMTIEARVMQVWAKPKGQRLLLGDLSIARLDSEQTPKYVRVTTRRPGAARVGDRVRLRASLRPPSRPALPGSFDFERKAIFEQIGAYGFTLGSIELTEADSGGVLSGLRVRLNRLRQVIGARIRAGSAPATVDRLPNPISRSCATPASRISSRFRDFMWG